MSFRKPIIVDTDAGVDDAVAFLLLLNDPAVEVKAITTVSGNVSVDKVTRNIGLLLAELELDIPIYSGLPPLSPNRLTPLQESPIL